MRKAYITPTAEKLEFQYEKVFAASNQNCGSEWKNVVDGCQEFNQVVNYQ